MGTLYLRAAVHRRGQRHPTGLGTNMTGEQPSAQAPTETSTQGKKIKK